jgi:hypothetical protein
MAEENNVKAAKRKPIKRFKGSIRRIGNKR